MVPSLHPHQVRNQATRLRRADTNAMPLFALGDPLPNINKYTPAINQNWPDSLHPVLLTKYIHYMIFLKTIELPNQLHVANKVDKILHVPKYIASL